MATTGLNIEEQKEVDTFRTEVVEPSMSKLVILDFWAEWCGPCKALTPVLEKVAAEYAEKNVMLVKVNVDEQKFIASQFKVQSIPTVYAMFQGQPVADLTPMRSESELKKALDEILKQLPMDQAAGGEGGDQQAEIDQFLAMAEQILTDGDGERAAGIFSQVIDMAPDRPEAQAGLIRALLVAGRDEDAQAAFAAIPPEMQDDPALEQAKAALQLAADKPDENELADLRSKAEGDDPQAKLDYAGAAFAAGDRDAAAETLLAMIGSDPEWNEGAAKAKLLQIFEAVGLEDPWVSTTRRRLSLLLFG